MRWSEIAPNLSVWTMSGARVKNGRRHDVHLSQPVQAAARLLRSPPAQIRSIRRQGERAEFQPSRPIDLVTSITGGDDYGNIRARML